jgi:putative flavoprotein involved in K+ transport
MSSTNNSYKVIVIGGGQAGLTAGYYLKKTNIPFVILEANERVGDSWRNRWDSLRLFTPAKFNGLPEMPFPSSPDNFPGKDEMADYLENYAAHFKLPVETGTRVDALSRKGNSYCITARMRHFTTNHVVIAMSSYQHPRVPKFAKELNADIVQLHSFDYRNPSQFQEGDVLVVGAGNSGAEIALEAAKNGHRVWLSGRHPGHVPFNIEGTLGKLFLVRFVLRLLFHRVLTISTPLGRKVRPKILSKGGPLVRTKPKQLIRAGIKRVSKLMEIHNGSPVLEDQQVLDVKNVVWCTGFSPSFSWIDILCFNGNTPLHYRGVVEKNPGLYFVGLHFLYSLSSAMIHGVARDADYVVKTILQRMKPNMQRAYLEKEDEKEELLYQQKSVAR